MLKSFDDVFEDVTKFGTKIKTDEYQPSGKYQIIDQGQAVIAGYTDLEDGVFENVPAIIFGDHTRIVKYVDKPFFLGADGVKVLRCRFEDADYRYLYYALKSLKIPNTGYNRHFKWLKEEKINYPNAKIRSEIVSILDGVLSIIECRQRQLQKLDEFINARFVEMFIHKSWNTVCAGSIMTNLRNGVSPSNIGSYPAKVLTLSAITQGSFNPVSWKNGMFDSAPPSDKRVTALDFYMCRGNGNKNLVGAGVYSKEDISDLVFPDTVIAATVDLQKVCLAYLFNAWRQPSVREQIERSARTTNGTYKINQKVVSNIKLILPPMELQKQFAAFVEQIDKSKVAIQKALDDAQLLFDSLMQQYFS